MAPEAVWQVWQRHTNPTTLGQLILRKIIKIVATRCQILRLKCTKIDKEGEREGKKGEGRTEREERRGTEKGAREEGRGGERKKGRGKGRELPDQS